MNGTPVRLKYGTNQSFSPGGGITVSYTFVKVKVKNIAFTKDVAIHFRKFDGTWTEEPLAWLANFGDYDVYQRSATQTPEFVIGYSIGGQTFWDNNNGSNYHLATLQNIIGGNVMLNKATARRGIQAGGGFVFTTSWVEGEIYLNNLSFGKQVGIRLSADGGNNWIDTFATYAGAATEAAYAGTFGIAELWKFRTPELNLNESSPVFQFATFYKNLSTGETFWDNNFGQDYKLGKADGVTIE